MVTAGPRVVEYDASTEGFDERGGQKVFVGHPHPGATATVAEGDRVALFRGGGVLIVEVTELESVNRYRGRVLEAQDLREERLRVGARITFDDGHVHVCWKAGSCGSRG